MLRRTRAGGFTLIELMIALALGSIAIAAAVGLLSSTLAMHTGTLHRTRMNQDLRQLLDVMQRDMSRAGAWGVAGAIAQAANTHDLIASGLSGSVELRSVLPGGAAADAAFAAPLSSATLVGRTLVISARRADGSTLRHELRIDSWSSGSSVTATLSSGALPATRIAAGSWTVLSPFTELSASGGNCVVFSYDENRNGLRDPQERYGYRYNAVDRAIRAVNNADSCAGGSWENVSDERVLRVDALAIAYRAMPIASGAGLQGLRHYGSFAVNAQLRESASADRLLRTGVAVRNDALR